MGYLEGEKIVMSELEEYGLDSPARAILLLALSLDDRNHQKSMNKLHFQKTIYYFEKLKQSKEVFFSNFKYGGVSSELAENMETLEMSGLVVRNGTRYSLTKEGERLAKQLKETYDVDMLRKLEFSKLLLNDLPDKELLFFMYMTFSETQINSIEYKNLVPNKEYYVKKLFSKERITATTAAQWLKMSTREFLESIQACD
jgi:uncharacterized protein YwgA